MLLPLLLHAPALQMLLLLHVRTCNGNSSCCFGRLLVMVPLHAAAAGAFACCCCCLCMLLVPSHAADATVHAAAFACC